MRNRRFPLTTLALVFAHVFALASAALAQQNVAPVDRATSQDPAQPELPQVTLDLDWFRWLLARRTSQELHCPFPQQSQEELDYVDQLLAHWETESSRIERYRARFDRWVADPVFGPTETFKTFSAGEIFYDAPDRVLLRVDSTRQWTPPEKSGAAPTYRDLGEAGRERWICDGESLIEFDHSQKKVIEHELPAEMQGRALADLALPFVLGIDRESIKNRYWLRVTTTPEAQARNEYVLEAYPKRLDCGFFSYRKLEIVLAASDFQVSAIKIHEPNDVQTIYQFTDRSSNWMLDPLDQEKLELWRSSLAPATPAGWERIE